MDIEIVESVNTSKATELLSYIEENIYSKLTKKDLDKIKKDGKGTIYDGLTKLIVDYKNHEVNRTAIEIRDQYKLQIEGYQEIIKELIENEKDNKRGYNQGKYQGD